jgi:hypothetical protein
MAPNNALKRTGGRKHEFRKIVAGRLALAVSRLFYQMEI